MLVINCNQWTWNAPQKIFLRKEIGRNGNQRKNQDHPDGSIVKID